MLALPYGNNYNQEQHVDIILRDPLNPHGGSLSRSVMVTSCFPLKCNNRSSLTDRAAEGLNLSFLPLERQVRQW